MRRSQQRVGPMEVAFRLLCVGLVVVQTARMGLLVQERMANAVQPSGASEQTDIAMQFIADHSEPTVTRNAWELESEIPWPWGNHTHHHTDNHNHTEPDHPDDKPDDATPMEVKKSIKDFKTKWDKFFGTVTIVGGIIAAIYALLASLDMCCKVFGGRTVYWAKEMIVWVKKSRKPLFIALALMLAVVIGTLSAMYLTQKTAIANPEKKGYVPATLGLFLTSAVILNLLGFAALFLLTMFYSCGGMFVQGSRALGKQKFEDTKAWRFKLYLEGMSKVRPELTPRVMSLWRRGVLVEA